MDTPELDEQLRRLNRGCLGKRAWHKSRADAKLGAVRVQRLYGYKPKPYHCPHCGGWHLTTKRLGR